MDIVATATGKIVPTGRSKVIQPFETGVVRAIRVADGQTVSAGDVLIELDPTINQGEIDHLRGDLQSAQLDIARLRAALADTDDPLAAFRPPEDANPAMVAMQRQFLVAQIAEHKAKIAALDGQKDQKQAELATIAATIDKLEAVIPTIQERVNIRKTLNEYGSRLQYFEVLQQLTESQQERLVQQSRYHEAEAALAAITDTRAQTVAEYRRTLFGELTEAERKATGFAADLSKAQERTKLQLLTAPVSGMVQQLAVHTVGGVVTPAQTLLVIVPSDSRLEIEAMVSNRDIGFVHAGDAVEIKVDTFDFTRYGLLHGQVLSISSDSIARDAPDRQIERQAARQLQRHQRAQGPGIDLRGAHLARPHADAGRGQDGQPFARHGGHRRDQDRLAPDHRLPAVAADEIQAGELARAVGRNLLIMLNNLSRPHGPTFLS